MDGYFTLNFLVCNPMYTFNSLSFDEYFITYIYTWCLLFLNVTTYKLYYVEMLPY